MLDALKSEKLFLTILPVEMHCATGLHKKNSMRLSRNLINLFLHSVVTRSQISLGIGVHLFIFLKRNIQF